MLTRASADAFPVVASRRNLASALITQGIFHPQAVRIGMWAKILLCVEPIQLVQFDVTDTNHVRCVVL